MGAGHRSPEAARHDLAETQNPRPEPERQAWQVGTRSPGTGWPRSPESASSRQPPACLTRASLLGSGGAPCTWPRTPSPRLPGVPFWDPDCALWGVQGGAPDVPRGARARRGAGGSRHAWAASCWTCPARPPTLGTRDGPCGHLPSPGPASREVAAPSACPSVPPTPDLQPLSLPQAPGSRPQAPWRERRSWGTSSGARPSFQRTGSRQGPPWAGEPASAPGSLSLTREMPSANPSSQQSGCTCPSLGARPPPPLMGLQPRGARKSCSPRRDSPEKKEVGGGWGALTAGPPQVQGPGSPEEPAEWGPGCANHDRKEPGPGVCPRPPQGRGWARGSGRGHHPNPNPNPAPSSG